MPPEEITKATPDMTELGMTGLNAYGGRIDDDILLQLRGDRRLKTYQEMSENDSAIGAMLYAIEVLMRPMKWTVEPGGEAPEDKRAADLAESVLEDMSHTFADFLSEWMAAPVYGFAPFEIIWKKRNGANREPGKSSKYNDGLFGVRKLAIRHPLTRDRWLFDDAGGIQGMVQVAQFGHALATIPIEKLLLFRLMTRKGSPEGSSLLRRAFIPWYRKKRIESIEGIGVERDLAGLPVMYTPFDWHTTNSKHAGLLADAKKIVRNIRNDEEAGVVVPSIYDDKGNQLLKLELLSSNGRRNFDTNTIIQRLTREELMVALADVIVLGHEKVGSFALASSKTNLFAAGIGAMADDIESVLNRHLLPRLLGVNGIRVENPPQYRHGDIEQIDLLELGDYIQKLSTAGFPLFPTESGELERELLGRANLPTEELGKPRPAPEPFGDEADDEDGAGVERAA